MGIDDLLKLLGVENVTVVGVLLVMIVGEAVAVVALWRRCSKLEAEANDYANRFADVAEQHDKVTDDVAARFERMSESMSTKYEALIERFMQKWFKDGE